jgi:Leucine carboxyl methyltransferase
VCRGDRRIRPTLRQQDDWTREFLAHQPDASVLHLGCGLDSRAFRLDVPERVRWYDLDFPDVIELRRRLYPERAGYRLLASSVTDPGWLDEIPVDRPTLVVAKGVLPYLTAAEVRQLLVRLTDRLPSGELIFDGVAGPTARISKLFQWRLGDPREIERWNPWAYSHRRRPSGRRLRTDPLPRIPRQLPPDEQDPSHPQRHAATPLPQSIFAGASSSSRRFLRTSSSSSGSSAPPSTSPPHASICRAVDVGMRTQTVSLHGGQLGQRWYVHDIPFAAPLAAGPYGIGVLF